MADQNELSLLAMELVETFSKRLKTISWLWGGFILDIYENRILREHDDLDYLTLNLHDLIPQFSELFANRGWQVSVLENGDLKLKHEIIKIHLGHVEMSDRARWTHNGEKGSIWFPSDWLRPEPMNFCDVEVHVVAPEFQFVMLEKPHMLNPNWKHREKDVLAQEFLRRLIESRGINPQSLFGQVRDTEVHQAK